MTGDLRPGSSAGRSFRLGHSGRSGSSDRAAPPDGRRTADGTTCHRECARRMRYSPEYRCRPSPLAGRESPLEDGVRLLVLRSAGPWARPSGSGRSDGSFRRRGRGRLVRPDPDRVGRDCLGDSGPVRHFRPLWPSAVGVSSTGRLHRFRGAPALPATPVPIARVAGCSACER